MRKSKFPLFIALRYLFSKKSNNAINILSTISVVGVAIATIAMVCILSVYNGFSSLFGDLFAGIDPDIKISPKIGKVFVASDSLIAELRNTKGVNQVSQVVEDNALAKYRDRQQISLVKGVDINYSKTTNIEQSIIDGTFRLTDPVASYATIGAGVAMSLNVSAGFMSPLELYAPKRTEKVSLTNPSSSFDVQKAFVTAVFMINQGEYDQQYIIVPIEMARKLFQYEENQVSALEIYLHPGASDKAVRNLVNNWNNTEKLVVKNRMEQQASAYKMLNIEKWMSFFIMAFILAIAAFNVVSSLSMLIIEKKKDMQTLTALGANNTMIRKIFLYQGWLITIFGAIIGMILGITLCLIQQHSGLIKLGQNSGAFIVESYPVEVLWGDMLVVIAAVIPISLVICYFSVRKFTNLNL